MPSRVIRGEFNSSESMASRSLLAELLFVKLILAVDDYGRTDGRPRIVRAFLYAMRDDVSIADVEGWLEELVTGEDPPVLLYVVDHKPYIQLVNWEKHRSDSRRGAKSRWPAPPGVQDFAASGVVYFVQSGDNRIKIGFSEVLETRLETLRTMVPDFKLLGTMDSPTRALEKKLHRQFADFRKNGEWFEASPEILAFISEHAKCPAVSRDVAGQGRTSRDKQNGPPGVSGLRGVEVAGSRGTQTTQEPEPPPAVCVGLAAFLNSEISKIQPGRKVPKLLVPWALVYDKAIRLDRRSAEDLESQIRWLFGPGNQDSEARFEVFSAESHRKKFDAIERMRLKPAKQAGQSRPPVTTPGMSDQWNH